MNKKRVTKIIILLLVIAAAAYGYMTFGGSSAGSMFREITAQRQDVETWYTFSGNLESPASKVYYGTAKGEITKLLVNEGDEVEKNDYVLQNKSGAKMRAPMTGTVTDIYVEVGDEYVPGDMLFRVADYSEPEIRIKIDEYDVDAVKKGMTVTVRVHAIDKEFEAEVKRVASEATVAGDVAYYEAVIVMPQDDSLRMGMTCEVIVPRESVEDAIVVPVDAVRYDDDGRPYVYCYNSERQVVTQNISLGINDGSVVEVTLGLSNGDTVLVPKSMFETMPMMPMMSR